MTLCKSDRPHGHVFSATEAAEIGLNISTNEDKMKLLRTYKQWISSMLTQQETKHIINTYCPQPKKEEQKEKPTKQPSEEGEANAKR